MTYTATDLFCGAGGSSTGLVAAGFELKLAANHSAVAITTHSANHPDAEHLCADINNVDMRRLPRTDVLWASPICTEISPAGGNRRTGRPSQLGLTDDEYEPVECSLRSHQGDRVRRHSRRRGPQVQGDHGGERQ